MESSYSHKTTCTLDSLGHGVWNQVSKMGLSISRVGQVSKKVSCDVRGKLWKCKRGERLTKCRKCCNSGFETQIASAKERICQPGFKT